MADASISWRLNRLKFGPAHLAIVFIIGGALFFEFYDLELSGVLGSVLSDEFGVTGQAQAMLLGSAFLGMFFGAIFLNRMADIVGRKRAFVICLLVYSVFTFVAAFSPNVAILITCRFLAGVGIGALPPACDTYLSEMLPSINRGRIMALTYTVQFLAFPVQGILARVLVPQHFLFDGWRWLFIIGSIAAAVIWMFQQALPESPRWLEAVGRDDEADRIVKRFEAKSTVNPNVSEQPAPAKKVIEKKQPISALFSPRYRKRTSMIWSFQILQSVGYYSFGTLVPVILAAEGYNITETLTFTTLSFIGYPLGSLLSLPIIDRIERKWLIVGAAFCMALFGVLFGTATTDYLIVIFGFLYTLVSNIFSNSYHIYQVEIYPTKLRATGSGVGYSLSRLSSGAMPFALLPLLHSSGPTSVFIVVAAIMVAIMIIIGTLGPRTNSRSLEDVNEKVAA